MKKIYALLMLTCFIYQAKAQTIGSYDCYVKDNSHTREHPVDFIKMIVDVSFEPKNGLVKGKVDHIFTPLQQKVDSIFFDGPGIRISKALLDGKELKYSSNATGIVVYPIGLIWDKTYKITFEYEANPKKGIYFIGWNDNVTNEKLKELGHIREQIWTQGQGTDNRYWIPSYDEHNDKVITETYITFNKEFNVLSNGVLKEKKENKDGTYTWHYAMSKPHANYLLMVAIDKFAVKKTTSKRGVPVQFWYYPEFPERVGPSSLYTEEMVDFMEEELGVNYPWESYSQVMVQDFIYGAMENTTATIFGDFFNVNSRAFLDRNYLGVNMHEFTHQWFGDLITARSYNNQWLQESFATHYPKYFFRKIYGEDYFQWQRRLELNSILDAEKNNRLPIVNTTSGTTRVYQKGSAVIDMLRYVLGNDQFKRMITYYLKKHDYKNVETNDLEVSIHESSGRTLDWFFDQWCYRGGVPAYEVQKQIYTSDNNEYIRFDIKQTHAIEDVVGYFKMPVVFDIYYKDGTKTSETHWVEGAETIIHIKKDKDKDIAFCLFDPNSQIVKTINFKKSTAELLEQLKTAEHMIDRYDALLALKDVKIEEKRETLYRIYDNETFYAMRVEIINQLAKDKDPHSVIVIEKGLEDKQVQVRQAAINVIDEVNAQQKTLLIKMLNDSSYSIIESVLEKLSNIYPNETQQWLEITKNEYGMANALKIKWLYISYLNGNKVALDQLIEYASSNYEFRTRINAMNAIKTLGIVNQSMLKNIFNATLSWNSRLAGPANEALSQLSMNVVNKKAISDFFKTNSWTEKERELIKEKGLKY